MSTPLSIALAAKDLTRDGLAKAVGSSPVWIGELVRGSGRPSPDLAARIADVLEVSADDLFAEPEPDVIVRFVRRTAAASGVPERIEDRAAAEKVAAFLKGGGADAATA